MDNELHVLTLVTLSTCDKSSHAINNIWPRLTRSLKGIVRFDHIIINDKNDVGKLEPFLLFTPTFMLFTADSYHEKSEKYVGEVFDTVKEFGTLLIKIKYPYTVEGIINWVVDTLKTHPFKRYGLAKDLTNLEEIINITDRLRTFMSDYDDVSNKYGNVLVADDKQKLYDIYGKLQHLNDSFHHIYFNMYDLDYVIQECKFTIDNIADKYSRLEHSINILKREYLKRYYRPPSIDEKAGPAYFKGLERFSKLVH